MQSVKKKKSNSLAAFMNNDNVVGYIFAAPFLIGFFCLTLIPMGLSSATTRSARRLPSSA